MPKKKSKAPLKREQKEAWKNRHNDPTYKAIGSGYMAASTAKTEAIKKKTPDWAGDVGRAHRRNQKHESEKGYREDYR